MAAGIPWSTIFGLVSGITSGAFGIASSDATAASKDACADAAYDAQAEKQKLQLAVENQAQVMLDKADCMETPTEKYFMGRPESEKA